MKHHLADAAATDRFGARLATAMPEDGLVVSLVGELGAGKTALVRAVIQTLGHDGPVVSPSYTLIEPYTLGDRRLYHLDLYRLGDPEELEFLGVRELDDAHDWVFIEWADQGAGHLPAIDLLIELVYAGDGRHLTATGQSARGERLIQRMADGTDDASVG